MEFIYGWHSGSRRFEIVTQQGVNFLEALRACRTWGEYADLLGTSWSEMVEDREDEFEGLSAESPFRLSEHLAMDFVVNRTPDPRTDAYDVLSEKLPPEVRSDSRLQGKIEWSHGSPAGHLECVAALDEEGIRLLEWLAREAGRKEYIFRRDDALIKDVLYGWWSWVPPPLSP